MCAGIGRIEYILHSELQLQTWHILCVFTYHWLAMWRRCVPTLQILHSLVRVRTPAVQRQSVTMLPTHKDLMSSAADVSNDKAVECMNLVVSNEKLNAYSYSAILAKGIEHCYLQNTSLADQPTN